MMMNITKKSQRGLSLIEMMIAITIGLILLAGVAKIFSSNKKAYRYNAALNEIHDNGQYALDFIANNLYMAGYVPNVEKFQEYDWSGDGGVDKADMEIWAYGTTVLPIVAADLTGTSNDLIAVNRLSDPADATATDCVGQTVAAPGVFTPNTTAITNSVGVRNVMAIIPSGLYTGRPTLTCNGIELVDGIEHLQFLYGVDTDVPSDGNVDRYMTWADLTTAGVDQRQIGTIQIGIIVSSSKNVREANDPRVWQLLGENIGTKADRKLRKAMTVIVKLRNRCSRIPGLTVCV